MNATNRFKTNDYNDFKKNVIRKSKSFNEKFLMDKDQFNRVTFYNKKVYKHNNKNLNSNNINNQNN